MGGQSGARQTNGRPVSSCRHRDISRWFVSTARDARKQLTVGGEGWGFLIALWGWWVWWRVRVLSQVRLEAGDEMVRRDAVLWLLWPHQYILTSLSCHTETTLSTQQTLTTGEDNSYLHLHSTSHRRNEARVMLWRLRGYKRRSVRKVSWDSIIICLKHWPDLAGSIE